MKYDIIIVGGGMVGTSLACALGDSSLSIALIESHTPHYNWPEESYDLRVSAITRASQSLLDNLGVWESIRTVRTTAYQNMQVWDASGSGNIHFDSADIGEANLGHIVENRIINKALLERAKSSSNINIFCPAKPEQLTLTNDPLQSNPAKLQLDDGTQLEAKLIIGADGGQSWVRQQASISVDTRDYEQTAVVANVTTELSHQHTAWQRFLPTGPLAFLPLSDTRNSSEYVSSIVWSATPEKAEHLCTIDQAEFLHELKTAFDAKLGKILSTGPRASFPIKGQHATHYVKPQLALIGDAAHTIHPLAGQGVNLGFADVQSLSEIILNAHNTKKNIGSLKTLRRYERSRRGDNLLMLETMGIFKKLFSNNTPGLRELRNAGLNLSNRSTMLKQFFMARALG